MRIAASVFVMAVLTSALPTAAQEKNTASGRAFYRVEFTIRDGDPAASKGGRRYVITIDNEGRGSYRVGSRVPYVSGAVHQGSPQPVATQYQYYDAGVNIDCRAREVASKVMLDGNIEISSVVAPDKGSTTPNPTVNSVRMNFTSLTEPNKPATLVSVDDPVTTRRLEVTATVTRTE